MNEVRVCMEWGFGKIIQYLAYLDFCKNLKVLLQPVAKYFAVGALLTNCYTCLYDSVTSSFFDLEPPTLEESTWQIETRLPVVDKMPKFRKTHEFSNNLIIYHITFFQHPIKHC